MGDDDLTKIYVDLPGHWAGFGGESLWAKALGGDRYRIENVPFYAYGLNYHDIVRAISRAPDQKPEVVKVIEPSGHRTLRVFFEEGVTEGGQELLLDRLAALGATCERSSAIHVALDVPPEASYDGVCRQLGEWQRQGTVGYETCEVRVPGKFTSALGPEEEPEPPG